MMTAPAPPAPISGFAPRPRLIAALLLISLGAGLAPFFGASWQAVPAMIVLGLAGMLILGHEPPPAANARSVDDTDPFPPALDPLFDAIAEPLVIVRDGRVIRANTTALSLLGRDILSRDLRLVIRNPAVAELLRTPAASDVTIALDDFGRPGDRWQLRARPASVGTRVVQLVDRTAAHAADRMRVDFVANASHELRTPLAAVLGFVETLQDDETGEDRVVRQRFLEIIAKEGRRMLRLVEDLLSLSRIEAERHRAPSEQIDLGALAETVAAIVATQYGERGGDLEVTREGETNLTGDRPELTQLTQNLMANALKYGAPGTPVAVTVADNGDGVTLVVADRGEGIAAKHLPRLTERFYRADPGRSRAVGGTGLGLAIVKHIVERHRGTLDIASELGVGTTVTVQLPRRPGGAVTKLSR